MSNRNLTVPLYSSSRQDSPDPAYQLNGQAQVDDKTPMEEVEDTQEALNSKIVVNNLDFYYGKLRALQAINLQIPERRVTAFIGPSGCGKSTVLRTFNRIYELYPDQHATGEVLLDGQDILSKKFDLNLLRSKIGMVF